MGVIGEIGKEKLVGAEMQIEIQISCSRGFETLGPFRNGEGVGKQAEDGIGKMRPVQV